MPLINCPECKSEISDTSLKCKDCGFPIKETLKNKNLIPIDNIKKQVISKKWQMIHIIISTVLSISLMLIIGTSKGDILEEGMIAFLCTISAYWLILSIIVRIKSYNQIRVKSVAKRFISKPWLRLHIILSIIGGCVPMIFYSIIVGIWDSDDCGSALTWPIFYWLCILILWGISKFNNGIISKRWLTVHTIINLCISIILIIYTFNIEYYSSYSNEFHKAFDNGQSMMFGQLSFIIYLIILFVSVWLINGFKQDDTEII